MTAHARLIATVAPAHPAGLVLLLHGGASRRHQSMVSPAQLSVLRMIPIARRIARAGHGRLAVFRLLNSHRGWNENSTPVMDTRWALRQLARQYDRALPVCLVGHSLGGRAALLAGAEAPVVAAVALNPWLDPTDDADLTGCRVLIVHGTRDRVASLADSIAVANRLATRANVRLITIDGGKHAMLRHGHAFERQAAAFVTAALLPERPATSEGRRWWPLPTNRR